MSLFSEQVRLRAWLKDAAHRTQLCGRLDAPIPDGVDPRVVLGERIQSIVAAVSYASRDVDHRLSVRCDPAEGLPRAVTVIHDAGRDTMNLKWSPSAMRASEVRRYCLRVDPAEFDYEAPDAAEAFLHHLTKVVAAIAEPTPRCPPA